VIFEQYYYGTRGASLPGGEIELFVTPDLSMDRMLGEEEKTCSR